MMSVRRRTMTPAAPGRLLVLALALLLTFLALPAAASLGDPLDRGQQGFQPGGDLALLGQGALYQASAGSELTALGYLGDQGQASGTAAASATYWWYMKSGHYNVLMPGTSQGPDANYYIYARGLSPYLGKAYDTARDLLGVDNDGYGNINLYLENDPHNWASGWYFLGSGDNSVHLNLAYEGTYAYFGSVAAHETTHLIFDHKTDYYNRDPKANTWFTEALAYYAGDSAYDFGSHYDYNYYSSQLRAASHDGALRRDWVTTGQRYGRGQADSLDYMQLTSIGYFLANSAAGWGAIQSTVRGLAAGQDLDSALAGAYGGLVSGMYDTASGPGVGTLYSRYLNYYLGHY